MSIQSEITRLSGNVSDAFDAIEAKGVSVPANSTSDDLATLISQISGGGTGAITIVDYADPNGGFVREIIGVDISDTTAVASDVASGKYFYDADGVKTAGTASGGGSPTLQTVSKTYTPTTSQQTETVSAESGYDGLDAVNITVNAMPAGSVVIPPMGGDTEPIISVSNTGLITASYSETVTITPTVTPGYVSSVADGTFSYSGSDTMQLSTQAATTITPTTSQQTAVAAGKYTTGAITVAAMPSGSVTAPSSISGTSATVSTGTNTLTLSKTVSVTPSVTTAGYISAGTAGNSSVSLTASVTTQAAQTIHPSTTDQSIAASRYLTGAQTIKAVTLSNLTAENIKSGVVIKVGDSTDDDCVTSVTGSYTGSGGTSMNFQVSNTQVRISNKTSLSDTGLTLTVSETGTYNVYWSAFRSNTSSGYTWGTRLYIGSTAYGTENTTWTNSYNQINKLTGVSLTKDQVLHVYGRTRSGSYYLCCSNLILEQTA